MALKFKDSGHIQISRIIVIIELVICVVLMSVYGSEGQNGALHTIQTQLHGLLAPFEAIGASGGAAVEGASDAVSDATADGETLSALTQRNEELTNMLAKTEEYRLEAERLSGLLNMKETYRIEGVSGHVIGRSTDAWNQTITIDIGTDDGVDTGLTVVGPSGVIGQVISVSQGSSTVRLLTDPQSGVAAMIQSSRADGIVRGSLVGLLYLENIDEAVEVQVGDVVLTSGLGGSFMKGLLIGTVVRVEGKAADGTRTIIVSQNELISALEEVTVVFSASEATSSATADLAREAQEGSASEGEADGPQDGAESEGSGGAGEGERS